MNEVMTTRIGFMTYVWDYKYLEFKVSQPSN